MKKFDEYDKKIDHGCSRWIGGKVEYNQDEK